MNGFYDYIREYTIEYFLYYFFEKKIIFYIFIFIYI